MAKKNKAALDKDTDNVVVGPKTVKLRKASDKKMDIAMKSFKKAGC